MTAAPSRPDLQHDATHRRARRPSTRARSVGLAVLLGLPLVLTGCKDDKAAGEDATEDTEAAPATLSVFPPKGGQGTTVEIDLSATSSFFDFDLLEVDLGDGITVDSVAVDDGWGARATITIAPDAELGPRDVTVTTSNREKVLTESFDVIAESFRIDPGTVRIGETVDIDMVGANTTWEPGVTWPSFGDGVAVDEFTVLSETLATATLTIDPATLPGWRNVVMDNGGGDLVTLYDGLKIDRVSLAATFDPTIAEQGDTVEFTVRARGTEFREEQPPRLTFFDRFGENPDIVVDNLVWLDAENVYGQMTLSNAAALGMREVRIDNGEEGIVIPDAFEVIGGGWDLSEVAIDLSFTVVRSKDNATGIINESVRAQCIFYIPLDPPCPQGGGSGSGSEDGSHPSSYDVNGAYGATGEGSGGGGAEDCPFPTTVPAGDFVWLESDVNTITMEKTYDDTTGMVYYTAPGLVMADYVPDNLYDLHTQGEPEGEGIGEHLLEEVQPTVPKDWHWTSPDLWGNYTHNRAEPFVFTWTAAGTYPDAIFYVSLFTEQSPGPLSREDWVGYVGAIPFDDGYHSFSAEEMSWLAPGGVPVYAYSFLQGREFGLPDSIYQTNTAPSYIYLSQYMVLE